MSTIFVCIVQPKVIEFNVSDQKLHRAQKDEELRSELESLKLPQTAASCAEGGSGQLATSLFQPGGGCRLLSQSTSVSVASVGSAVCVFEGSLTNVATLAEDYAPVPEDEPTPVPTALTSAQLVCHMYAKVGVEMLGLLRGSFTFVLYESKTSRVLAARDGGGFSPLFQARSAKGSLVLTNSNELIENSGCTDKVEFLPGDYKYGWSATPRRYQPADHVRLSRRSLELPASAHYHHHYHNGNHHFHGNGHGLAQPGGVPGQQGNSRNGSRRASCDRPEIASSAAAAPASAAVESNGSGGRHHNRNHHPEPQPRQQMNGVGGSPLPQNRQHGSSHPHRTYVINAEDARLVKGNPARQQQQQAAAPVATAAGGATAATAAPDAPWTASAAAATPATGIKAKDPKAQDQEGGGNWRGNSARGASSGHHNRRRSMDTHGSWRLGSGQGPAAGKQLANGQGQQQQQPPSTPNGGKARGRRSTEGRTPVKQQLEQQKQNSAVRQVVKPIGAAASSPVVSGAGPTLRVDAPEFVCTRAVQAAVPSVPVAAAVVSAP
ncbi:hypothetical protein Vretimale_19105 [Volvox reticuliferus]|uniref:DUF3700 domain-containing protein n=1 Tax=Volvox reticuliferus TaxID=1737510 RepID=A0A8J4GW50_9CHLO|nr:hypothetical protein Vretifemale_20538 [Volvox reticuliferus]GIM16471.1 hypothetical protein Vretimale_19105 [Volvox reticuliferus]